MSFNTAAFLEKIVEPNLSNFDELALQLFVHQYEQNPVLKQYAGSLGLKNMPAGISEIPFLPVDLFKTHDIKCGEFEAAVVFTSSGTSGMSTSRHFVKDPAIYSMAYLNAFELFYGDPASYCILALLPSYLEREGSSLVWMVRDLVERSQHPLSGFYLDDHEKLFDTLVRLRANGQKTLLMGVTFALLDFAGQFSIDMPDLVVMETGGMKGRRKELTREEVHQVLKQQFSLPAVHSEYGMTELLSQAYAKHDGKFYCPPWMKIVITDANDPFQVLPAGKTGVINVIDLANIHSCAFIKTADLGRMHADGAFEVLGRLDHSDARGCSLLYL